jgi:hypothetical protein
MTPPTGQKAKMLAGELYLATDPQLVAEDQRAQLPGLQVGKLNAEGLVG